MADAESLIASWLTPSSLFIFIFVNLVIGTIAITSRFGAGAAAKNQLVRSPSLLRRFNLTDHYKYYEPECTQSQLVRTPSLLERVTSFKSTQAQPEPELVRSPSLSVSLSRLYRSDSMHREQEDPDSAGSMERLRVETTSCIEDEEVDAKADDFINRFKKQLRLQRIDSLLRYREMLRRGGGGNS